MAHLQLKSEWYKIISRMARDLQHRYDGNELGYSKKKLHGHANTANHKNSEHKHIEDFYVVYMKHEQIISYEIQIE